MAGTSCSRRNSVVGGGDSLQAGGELDLSPEVVVDVSRDRIVLTWLHPLTALGVRGGFGVRFTLLVLGAAGTFLGHWWLRE